MRAADRILTSNRVIQLCYVLCIGAQIILCMFTPFISASSLQIPVYVIHIGILGSGILLILQNVDNGRVDNTDGMLLAFVFTCFASMVASGSTSYSTVVRIACLLEMLFAMRIAYCVGAYLSGMWIVRIAAWLTALGFVVQYSANLETHYKVFFLGLNKNYSGAMLLLNAALCLVLSTSGSKLCRAISIMAFVSSSYLLSISRCRTGQAVLIVIIVAVLFFRRFLCSRWYRHVVLIAPIVLMVLLLAVPSLNDIEVFGGTGSLTSGRENLYAKYFLDVGNWFFLGDIKTYQLSNAHNGLLALIASLGVIGYIVWYMNQQMMFEAIRPRKSDSVTQSFAYVALVSCMLMGCTEALIYVHGQQMSIMLSLFVYVARYTEVHMNQFKPNRYRRGWKA